MPSASASASSRQGCGMWDVCPSATTGRTRWQRASPRAREEMTLQLKGASLPEDKAPRRKLLINGHCHVGVGGLRQRLPLQRWGLILPNPLQSFCKTVATEQALKNPRSG
ncbi:uncharacterized protein LOC119322696 isoform X3 [Triticum dicoccoides]|uniref:uncharacterized protein LOC119322696 isoform X3 n=1 Tax=Triticum dicoccoides TaxID=85692 RepID=UPI00188EDF0A|nr:uncharacterized protein LOC119322696 isoform X3 [Triticum dicoccoides]